MLLKRRLSLLYPANTPALCFPSSALQQSQILVVDTLVYVPLLGRMGGIGVVEICGMFVDTLSTYENSERDSSVIKAMIANSDYK